LSHIWPIIDFVPSTIFAVLGSISEWLDLYSEFHLVVAFLLVNPKQPMIKKLLHHFDEDNKVVMEKVGTPVLAKVEELKALVAQKFAAVTSGAGQ